MQPVLSLRTFVLAVVSVVLGWGLSLAPPVAHADQGAPLEEMATMWGEPLFVDPNVLLGIPVSDSVWDDAVVAEICRTDAWGDVRFATEYRDFNAWGYPTWSYTYAFGTLTGIEEYVYDEWGRLNCVDSLDPDGTYLFNVEYLYNDPFMEGVEFPDGVAVMTTVMDWSTFERVGGGTYFCFDDQGRLIARMNYDETGAVTFKTLLQYDADGTPVSESYYSGQDEFWGRTEFFRDGTNVVSSLTYEADGSLSSSGSYRYDQAGHLLAIDSYDPDATLEEIYALGWGAPEQLVGQPAFEEIGSRLSATGPFDDYAFEEIPQDGTTEYTDWGINVTCAGASGLVTLPVSWEGRFTVTAGLNGDGYPFCTFSGAHEGVGTLFTVVRVPQVDPNWPDYRVIGETSAGIVVVLFPTDLQCDLDVPGALEEFQSLSADIEGIVGSLMVVDWGEPDPEPVSYEEDGVFYGNVWLDNGTYFFALSVDGERGCVAQVDVTRYPGTDKGYPYGTFSCRLFHSDGTPWGTYGTTGSFHERLDLGTLHIRNDDIHFSTIDGWSFYWKRIAGGYEYEEGPTITSRIVRSYDEAVQVEGAGGSGDDPEFAGIDYWRGLELPEGAAWVVGDVYILFSDLSATECTVTWAALGDAVINGQPQGQKRCSLRYYHYDNDPAKGVYVVIDGLQYQWDEWIQGDWVETHTRYFMLVQPDYTLSDYADLDLVSTPGVHTTGSSKVWVMTDCGEEVWAALAQASM